MAERVLVDGVPTAHVASDDRGLAYGDGVFRTVRIAAGQPLAWSDHLERLRYDCAALALPLPRTDALEQDIATLFPDAGHGVLKIMLTRGSGGRGYTPPVDGSRRIVSAHALAGRAPVTLELVRSPITLAVQPRLAGVKHLNRLEQVLARAECQRRGQADAWMQDASGFVVATTMRNLFFVDGRGQWFTPAITRAGIIGATRQRLIRGLQGAGIDITQTDITPDRLDRFAGALACNSVAGIAAVTRLDERALHASETIANKARKVLN